MAYSPIKALLDLGAAVQPGPPMSTVGFLLRPNAKYGTMNTNVLPRAAANSRGNGQSLREIDMNSIPQTSGVYQILCIPTNKVYIGSASNLQRRQRDHWAALRRGIHHSPHLQAAWNKYGESAFVFAVLEECASDRLVDAEQRHIDRTRCYDRSLGFNSRRIAESNIGVKISPEASARLSTLRRGKARGPMPELARRAISWAKRGAKYTPHSEDARRAKSERQMGRSVSGETRAKISQANKGRVPSAQTEAARDAAISKEWIAISPDGEIYQFHNLEGFCREHGLTAVSMGAVARGEQKHHKGWKCSHKS